MTMHEVDEMKNIQVRVKNSVKEKADNLFQKLGTSTNEAIKIFLQMSINKSGFPFAVKVDDPEDLLEWVNSKKLPYSEEQIMESYKDVSGSFSVDSDFDMGVLNEDITLNGFVNNGLDEELSEDEDMIAKALLKIIDIDKQNLLEVADAASADYLVVAEGLTENSENFEDYSTIAILDEFFVFSDKISAKNRFKLFKDYFIPYLKSRDVDIVAFLNPGFWRTESSEEQKALVKVFKDNKIFTVGKLERWNDSVNVLYI